ncbi:transcription factor SPT20 homolog isoform X2 [Hydra vulgaris]|uniref:transcription factor SPT20 homolog isoform X2 n=1 Tax=Hydra vulgaris TaxID=6087 RepID=UPI001F5FDAAA|nr:transcription factor SPT20 homolog isoform X1 [Hydra vulgaris]
MMLSPVGGLDNVDPFQMLDKGIPDFEKVESKKSLLERMLECYKEETMKQDKNKGTVKQSYLLEKLVKEDCLSVLIVNLYPGNDGYSLMLKKKDGNEIETVHLPYEENEFLTYLDLQELPPLLVDILDSAQVGIYHDGCVIVELRDFRRNIHKNCDKSYVLLKPTSQTIIRDVNSMMSDPLKWDLEDKQYLESQLVLALQPRISLDPSPNILTIANKIQYQSNKWNNKGLKRALRHYSQPYLNRAVLCSNTQSPACLRLHDFINSHHDKRSMKSNRATQHIDMWKQRPVTLTIPSKIDVNSYAKVHEQPKYTTDYTPEKIQEIILEGEKTNNRSYFCRVTIQRRGSTGEYIGDLYLEEDYLSAKDESHKDGRSCRFSLGNRQTAQRYLQQFQELYTEEGRKSVKISTFVANQGNQQKVTTVAQPSSVSTTPNITLPKTTESTLTLNLSRTFSQPQNAVFSQGNTYILASSVPGLQQQLNLPSNVVMSLSSSLAQSLVSGNTTFSIGGNPYFVNASGNLQQAVNSKPIQSPAKVCGNQVIGNDLNSLKTTNYIQPIVSGATMSASHAQLTAVPIAVQGNSVNIVQGNIGAQFITKATQSIRPAGTTGQIMLQVPGNLVPFSQMTRVAQQKLQGTNMASVMMHGKQVMVQGSPGVIQGQATFIPNQAALIPGLQGAQAAIIQGNSIFVQPNQSLIGSQHQGQTVMIQGQTNQHVSNSGTLLQGQSLQGQAVFIQGQPNTGGIQGQTILLQNQGAHQSQMQLITTSSSVQQQIQLVSQMKQVNAACSGSRGTITSCRPTVTPQVNLIQVQQPNVNQHQYQPIVNFTAQTQNQQPRPVLQKRRASAQQPAPPGNGKKKPPLSKPSSN